AYYARRQFHARVADGINTPAGLCKEDRSLHCSVDSGRISRGHRALQRRSMTARTTDRSTEFARAAAQGEMRPRLDFQDHLAALEREGLLIRVDRPINKDTELHPLVRWQFVGGMPENERRAFLFTNVVDSKGRRYDMPVVVGALAASPRIYAIGMGKPVEEIGAAWEQAIAHP